MVVGPIPGVQGFLLEGLGVVSGGNEACPPLSSPHLHILSRARTCLSLRLQRIFLEAGFPRGIPGRIRESRRPWSPVPVMSPG